MKLSDILPSLLDAGASKEAVMAIVNAYEAEQEEGKEKTRARWRKWREQHPTANASKRLQTVANADKRLVRADAPVEDKTSNLEIEVRKEESKKVARGTRLPSDFHLPDEWRSWAVTRGLPADRVPIEFEKMTNWAANAPASKAIKPDWFRAWRNWVIEAIDRLPQNRHGPPSSQVPSMSEMFRVIGDRVNADQPGPPEDRSGFRAAIPHLRTVGTG